MTERDVAAAIKAFGERLDSIEKFLDALKDSGGKVNKQKVEAALTKLDNESGFQYEKKLDDLLNKINFQRIIIIGTIIAVIIERLWGHLK